MRVGRVLHLAYRDDIAHLLTLPLPGRSPVVFSGRNDHAAGVFGESNTQERNMARRSFETPDGEDIEIDADDVVSLSAGEEEGTTVIELEDGDEVTVVATQLEVAAELGLNPLEYVTPEDDDESLEELVEDEVDEDE